MNVLDKMTHRQRMAWPDAVAEVERYGVNCNEAVWNWIFTFDEEVRPGRGHALSAIFADGEYFAQIMMDVYGYPSVSVSETRTIHSSAWEECECTFCEREREDEADD